MNRLRSSVNAGCWLLLAAGVAFSLAVKPIHSAIRWIMEEPARLEVDPFARTAIELIALIVLSPLILGGLKHLFDNGWGRTFSRIAASWLAGLKTGIVCLLVVLPLIVIRQAFEYAQVRWPYTLLAVSLYLLAPFWSLLLIRHLPAALLRGSLFERFDPKNFESS